MLRRCRSVIVCGCCLVAAATSVFGETRRPNIVLIVSDDQRPDTIAALGNTQIRTPALDTLVRRGASFGRAVCAYPICVASRAEMLTGCTTFRALQPYPYGKLNDALPTLPSVLQQAGYRTIHVGKWHVTGRPTDRGYTRSYGLFTAGAGATPLTVPLDRFGRPHTGYRGWVFQEDDGTMHPERGVGLTPETSVQIADAAIEAIRAEDERPLFLHVNFTAPHDPRLALARDSQSRSQAVAVSLPGNFRPEHPFDHGNAGGRDEVLLPRPLTADVTRDELRLYFALIEQLDAQVGRIVRTLAELNRLDDTIIVFTSDHGLAIGSHGLLGKQNMYEHTICVPLIVAGPGIPRRANPIAGDCYLRDLYPTICEWAGAVRPENLDGRSVVPLLHGDADELHPFIVGYFTDTQRMIRQGRWKYIRYAQAKREQLFDLERDPLELHDQIAAPQHVGLVRELRSRLDDWLKRHGDPLPPGT